MPEEAKLFIIEDDDNFADILTDFMPCFGHEVVGRAETLEEALHSVEHDFARFAVQVAIVDGNLSKGDVSGSDGQRVIQAISEHAPEVKTIGFSGNPIPNVDVDAGKRALPQELSEIIDNL